MVIFHEFLLQSNLNTLMLSPVIRGTYLCVCSHYVLTHLPLFMELSNGFLQALLFLLRENVGELVASFQESVEHSLIQLTEKLLARRGGSG